MVFLIAVSVLVLIGGALTLSQATMGVGLVAVACYLAILARLVQANAAQKDLPGLHEGRDAAEGALPFYINRAPIGLACCPVRP